MADLFDVNELGDELIRPHDFEILTDASDGTQEGMIDRIVYLGFEVRVELTLDDARRVWVQVTRTQAEELELARGQIVHLRKDAARSFAEA